MLRLLSPKPTVVCVLPRAGLGNRLLVWGKAIAFARVHGLPLHTVGWNRFQIGPWLRGERVKRYYGGYFKGEFSIPHSALMYALARAWRNGERASNPGGAGLHDDAWRDKRWLVFDEIPDWRDYFGDFREQRDVVTQHVRSMLRPDLLAQVHAQPAPEIGMHVRLGDYRTLKPGEEFASAGLTRTPQEYFRDMIATLRAEMGATTKVTLFSDGRPHELTELLSLPGVRLSEPADDIVDMLRLARSRVIVASAQSTFSYWAGFMSQAPLVLHPNHLPSRIRPDPLLFEGPLNGHTTASLVSSLR